MHTAPNGKVYIGITCKSIAGRWGAGGNGYCKHPYFWNAIQKYGWDNFKHEIILYDLSKEEASEKEREYIKKYKSNNAKYGYNQTSGGDFGYNLSPDSIARLSHKAKRQWERMSPDEKAAKAQHIKEIESRRTAEEKKEIRDRARKTRLEKYSPEEIAEQYRRAVESRKATMAGMPKQRWSQERKESFAVRMKMYWDEYHKLHPKETKKKKYRPPKVTIRLSQDDMAKKRSEATKRLWQDPAYREKVTRACGNKGTHWLLSEETKSKMRKPKSEETKAKMRKPKSEETRRKMREAKRAYFDALTPEQRKQLFGRKSKNKSA